MGKDNRPDEKNNPDENRTYRKKIAVRFIIVLIAAAAVLLIANAVVDGISKNVIKANQSDQTETVQLFEPDFDYNIFNDENYTELERWINYTYGGMTTRIFGKEDAQKTDRFAEFFFAYFDALMNGRSESFNDLFTESYQNKNGSFGRFTMQQIYDISVEYLESDSDESTGDMVHIFRVAFAVRRNDGTVFRYLECNKTRPFIYELSESAADDVLRINRIRK